MCACVLAEGQIFDSELVCASRHPPRTPGGLESHSLGHLEGRRSRHLDLAIKEIKKIRLDRDDTSWGRLGASGDGVTRRGLVHSGLSLGTSREGLVNLFGSWAVLGRLGGPGRISDRKCWFVGPSLAPLGGPSWAPKSIQIDKTSIPNCMHTLHRFWDRF